MLTSGENYTMLPDHKMEVGSTVKKIAGKSSDTWGLNNGP